MSNFSTTTLASPASVQNCDGITFANNHLENLSYYTPSGSTIDYTGVVWENTTGNATSDAIASNNYLENFNRGFHISGTNTGAYFTCNEFVNNYHGFYLNSATISDQEGPSSEATDNCFNYYYGGGSFPYGEQIAGSVNPSASWSMREPASCNSGSQPFTSCYCLKSTANGVLLVDNATANICAIPSDKSAVANPGDDEGNHSKKATDRLILYPNPSSSWVSFKLPEEGKTPSSIQVFDIQGRLVYSLNKPTKGFQFNVTDWIPGLYLVKMGDHNAKLIVR